MIPHNTPTVLQGFSQSPHIHPIQSKTCNLGTGIGTSRETVARADLAHQGFLGHDPVAQETVSIAWASQWLYQAGSYMRYAIHKIHTMVQSHNELKIREMRFNVPCISSFLNSKSSP